LTGSFFLPQNKSTGQFFRDTSIGFKSGLSAKRQRRKCKLL